MNIPFIKYSSINSFSVINFIDSLVGHAHRLLAVFSICIVESSLRNPKLHAVIRLCQSLHILRHEPRPVKSPGIIMAPTLLPATREHLSEVAQQPTLPLNGKLLEDLQHQLSGE